METCERAGGEASEVQRSEDVGIWRRDMEGCAIAEKSTWIITKLWEKLKE